MADSKSDLIINEHFATKAGENPPQNVLERPSDKRLDQHLDNALWQYACRVYSQAGMETSLLHLQDKHGADINLILQALWLASEGVEWTSACIPSDYGQWMAEQVLHLRKMRRGLKTDWVEQKGLGYEDFRQQVKALELKAEQYALAMLFLKSIRPQKGVTSTESMFVVNLNQLTDFFSIESALMLPLINIIDK